MMYKLTMTNFLATALLTIALAMTASAQPVVDLSKVDGLREHASIYFDPATLHTYAYRCPPTLGWGVWDKDDCKTAVDTGWTFLDAAWSGGFDVVRWFSPWTWRLNPLDFATQETARRVLVWVQTLVPAMRWAVSDETTKITGPYSRSVQWTVCADNSSDVHCFSAGLIANQIIRNEPGYAKTMFKAQVQSVFVQAAQSR